LLCPLLFYGQTIFQYATNSTGAADHSVLAKEVMKMEKGLG